MPANYPTVDQNHQISTASKHVLDNAHPASWLVDSREGPNDFGFDFEVQVAPESQVQATFRLQLKGTTSPAISADGGTLSIGLKVRTLNLYSQSADEVMLVVVVVALQANGKADHENSKVYWTWVADELKRLRGNRYLADLSDAQAEVTLKLSLAQTLTPDLDVLPYLKHRVRVARAMEDLTALANQTNPSQDGRAEPLEQLLINLKQHPELLSASFQGELDLPKDGVGRVLADGFAFVRAGRTALAEEVVRSIDRDTVSASSTLSAELFSLEGKIAMQRHQRARALPLFEQAYASHAGEKHLLAMAEVRFLLAIDRQDINCIQSIGALLSTVESDDGLSLLVRVRVALQDFVGAQLAVEQIKTSIKRTLAQVVLWSSQQRWAEVRMAADDATAVGGSSHEVVGLKLLAARAAWHDAMAGCASGDGTTELIPLAGPPGLDFHAAQIAWRYALEGLHSLRELGWPINVELLSPVAVVAAGAVGKQEEALILLREAASARPEYLDLQENVELLAIGAGNIAVALEANLRQEPNHAVLVRRACSYFQNGEYAECVASAMRVLADLKMAVSQTPMALALGSAAAAKLSRFSEHSMLLEALKDEVGYREYTFVAEYAMASLRLAGERSGQPLDFLRRGLEEYPSSKVLTANLFSNLQVDEEPAAREAVALAKRLRQMMALSAADQLRLINAYMTVGEWQDAELEARAGIDRFGGSDRLHAMFAITLEMQGRTAEAVEELERALTFGTSRISTHRNYLGICLRLGRLKAARDTIERLLAVEVDREERLELLRLNALLLMQESAFEDAIPVVQEVGRIVDSEVESEEGLYLILFAKLMISSPLAPQIVKDFDARATAFERLWPESQMFRRFNVADHAPDTASGLHDMLDALTGGDSRTRMKEFAERERGIRSGEKPIPFAMRPTYALHYVGDVFELWQAAKQSRIDDVQLHLSMYNPGETRATQVLQDTPLLDLPALLVLNDLGLFSVLLALFPRIAIPRHTISYISQYSRGFLAGGEAGIKAAELLAEINANLSHIEQPASDIRIEKVVTCQDIVRDYMQLAETGRWLVYADDAIARVLSTMDNAKLKPFSTLELLRAADDEEMLSVFEVAHHLAQLAKWHVGIAVENRFLIAALEGAVRECEDLSGHERLERFRHHEPFASLSRAIWSPDKTVPDLTMHMARAIGEVVKNVKSNADSISAVWALWLIRVRIMHHLSHGLSTDLLPFCLILVLKLLPNGAEMRAFQIALRTIELTLQPGRMSEAEEKVFIERLGACFAALAQRGYESAELLRLRFREVWQPGTRNADVFDNAYFLTLRLLNAKGEGNG